MSLNHIIRNLLGERVVIYGDNELSRTQNNNKIDFEYISRTISYNSAVVNGYNGRK